MRTTIAMIFATGALGASGCHDDLSEPRVQAPTEAFVLQQCAAAGAVSNGQISGTTCLSERQPAVAKGTNGQITWTGTTQHIVGGPR